MTEALWYARTELGCRLEVADVVADGRTTASKVNHCVPITAMRDGNPSRKLSKESSKIPVLFLPTIVLKIGVVHDENVALMGAFDNDNVAA